jgi:hypothetical protein
MLANLDGLAWAAGRPARAHLGQIGGRGWIKLSALCGRPRAPRQELLADAAVALKPAAPAVDLAPRPILARLWPCVAFDSLSFGRWQDNFESEGQHNGRSEVASHHVASLSVDITQENDALRWGAERLDELLACSASRLPTDFQLKVARNPVGAGRTSQWQSLATAMRWLHHGATIYQRWCKRGSKNYRFRLVRRQAGHKRVIAIRRKTPAPAALRHRRQPWGRS